MLSRCFWFTKLVFMTYSQFQFVLQTNLLYCFQRKQLRGLLYTAFLYLLKLESFVTAWKKMLPVNFFLCIPQKKVMWKSFCFFHKFHFGMNYAFKIPSPYPLILRYSNPASLVSRCQKSVPIFIYGNFKDYFVCM